MRVPKRARAPGAPPRDARRPRGASRRRRWIPPSAAAGSLLEVGQVEELEAPVALDRAVDEGHVVDCRAGSVSAGGPPRARPRPAPARAHSHLPGPATGSRARRRWRWRHLREGRRGRVRAGRLPGGTAGSLPGQVSLSEVKGAVSCREGAERCGRWKGLPRASGHTRGVTAARGGRRGSLTWRGGHLQSHAGQDQHCTQMETRG